MPGATDDDAVAHVRRTQAARRAATEQRLVDAATTLIAARGSRAVSIADVGRAAGYSRGIVTHQFGGKPGLLETVVLHAQNFEVPGAGSGSGLQQLTRLLGAYLKNLRDRAPASQAFLLMWTEALGGEPTLTALYAERDVGFRALLADLVRAGIDDHSIRADADPTTVALAIVGALRGIGLQLISGTVHQPALNLIAEQTITLIQNGLTHPDYAAR